MSRQAISMLRQTVSLKRLEFDDIILDLTNIMVVEKDCDPTKCEEYIIFMNIKEAFYVNFHLVCDLSLESLTLFIYEHSRLFVHGEECVKSPKFVDHIFFNASDNDNSMIVELCKGARVIVAKKLYPQESYHQRASGFMDFQRRNDPSRTYDDIIQDKQLRNMIDRDLETKLYIK